MELIERQEESWEHVFHITNIRPLRITYEKFLSEPGAVARAVLGYVVPGSFSCHSIFVPQLHVQRDQVSQDWKRRFLDEVAIRG